MKKTILNLALNITYVGLFILCCIVFLSLYGCSKNEPRCWSCKIYRNLPDTSCQRVGYCDMTKAQVKEMAQKFGSDYLNGKMTCQ